MQKKLTPKFPFRPLVPVVISWLCCVPGVLPFALVPTRQMMWRLCFNNDEPSEFASPIVQENKRTVFVGIQSNIE